MSSVRDELKDWKLLQGALGFFALAGVLYYVTSGNFNAREWVPLIPPSPTPNSLLFQTEALRNSLQKQDYSTALEQAERILARSAHHPEAYRARTVCMVRLGRFKEAEAPLRVLIGMNKNDLTSRLLLGIALRGQGDNARARDVLLRLLDHPLTNPVQKQTIRSILTSMDGVDPIFADRPTPTPAPSPSSASPSPEPPIPPIKVHAPLWMTKSAPPTPEPTPVPLSGPVVLPMPGMTSVATPTPLPTPNSVPERVILPATSVVPLVAPKATTSTKTKRKVKKKTSKKHRTKRVHRKPKQVSL